ncbi:MAG TPA: hypothetical protein VK923_05075, partial [Euzebyales bacterium]|nr:hypothetical protein [Euzebyales bacterium]
MATTTETTALLWSPPDDVWETTQIGAFARAAADRHGVDIGDYAALWDWSVTDLDTFWQLVVDHFEIRFHAE